MPHLFFAVPFCARISNVPAVFSTCGAVFSRHDHPPRRRNVTAEASNEAGAGESVAEGRETLEGDGGGGGGGGDSDKARSSTAVAASPAPPFLAASIPSIEKDIKKVVQKTAATFAPRASTASKNPAVLGTALYRVFEVQAYASMLVGGALSFNLLFPSNEPDIWRLMGMWSIWMFTIPSLRARDCSKNEKDALNYLFILIPLLNIIIPFFWKSFALVWSADTCAFFLMYAWKMGWIQRPE